MYLVPIKRRMWDLFILFGCSIGWVVLRARTRFEAFFYFSSFFICVCMCGFGFFFLFFSFL